MPFYAAVNTTRTRKPLLRVRLMILFAAAMIGVPSALAETIVSVSGTASDNFAVDTPIDQILAVSWTTSSAFSNVSIAVEVGNYDAGGSSIFAYLTTAIGPGETSANQIAAYNFSAGAGPETDTLFSGLSLGAGTYYLVLSGNFSQWWGTGGASSATTDTGAGVTFGSDSFTNTALALSNPPASSFHSFDGGLLFQVTGDSGGASGGASTPEPGSICLVATGVMLCGFLLWKRKRLG